MTQPRPTPTKDLLRSRARTMRAEPTPAEKALWRLLRDRRLSELKFRRQVPMGRYITDFVCFSPRLVVEADGKAHQNPDYDATRDVWFEAQLFKVLRYASGKQTRPTSAEGGNLPSPKRGAQPAPPCGNWCVSPNAGRAMVHA